MRRETQRLPELLQHVSWPALLRLAEDHGVIPLLSSALFAHGLTTLPPHDVALQLRELQRTRALSALKLTGELFRLTKLLKNAALEFATVKGPTLAVRAYGHAGAREYGDLDFVVRHCDVLRVHELITTTGYHAEISSQTIRAEKIPGQYLFVKTPDQILIEFHTEFTMRYFPRGLPIDDFLGRREAVSIDGHEVPALATEDELILICIHGSKHLWDRLSFVADVSGLLEQQKNLDLQRSLVVARQIGAERMLGSGLLLARDLLRAPIPPTISTKVSADKPVVALASQIARRLPSGSAGSVGLLSRARYRVAMSGGGLAGMAHLARLLVSPTQEDWGRESSDPASGLPGSPNTKTQSSAFGLAPVRRIARLAKKYRGTKKSDR
ncbi:MAG TPA: nucleotidyltransferase family protein [Candidatus Acidoferrum sp.]